MRIAYGSWQQRTDMMTNLSTAKDKVSAGDPISPKCAVIEVHVGELKQLIDAIDRLRSAKGT